MKIAIPKLILFPKRIVTVDLLLLKVTQSYTNKFFIGELKEDIKKNGLLCQLVVTMEDKTYVRKLIDGNHRYEAMKDNYTHAVAYEIEDLEEEDKFFSALNSRLWQENK